MKIQSLIFICLLSACSGVQKAYGTNPYCVAHRSLGFGGLENSLEAFVAASKSHARGIEFDLLHTKDGKTIVYHDDKLDRLVVGAKCPKKVAVKDLTLREIQGQCKLKNGEIIPTFSEAMSVLALYDSILFIEFKDEIVTESDLEVIRSYYSQRPEKIVLISFHEKLLADLERSKVNDDFLKQIRTLKLKKWGCFGSLNGVNGISAKHISSSRVRKLQHADFLVGVYTKDSPEEIVRYINMGVDFITTNNSPMCESLVESHR